MRRAHRSLVIGVARAIIADQGIHWCVVAAMAAAMTTDDPRALAVIRAWNASSRSTRERAMADLLPCPFCGGAAERLDVPAEDNDDENAGGSCIQCSRCTASTALYFDRKENLAGSWNRRTACDDIARWMIERSIPTGHGDSIPDLLEEMAAHFREHLQCLSEALRAQIEAHRHFCEDAGLDEQAHIDGTSQARAALARLAHG